jgi:hypothetical protein
MTDEPNLESFDSGFPYIAHPDWAELGVHPSELFGDAELDYAPYLPARLRWERLPDDELTWLTVAVIDDIPTNDKPRVSARFWWENLGTRIVGAALQFSPQDFEVTFRSWGVVFEVSFANESLADAFRWSPAMHSVMEQLGSLRVEVTSGRGGGTTRARLPRRPRPLLGSGAAELPIPSSRRFDDSDEFYVGRGLGQLGRSLLPLAV